MKRTTLVALALLLPTSTFAQQPPPPPTRNDLAIDALLEDLSVWRAHANDLNTQLEAIKKELADLKAKTNPVPATPIPTK